MSFKLKYTKIYSVHVSLLCYFNLFYSKLLFGVLYNDILYRYLALNEQFIQFTVNVVDVYLTDLQTFSWRNLLISHSVQEVKRRIEEDGATSTLSLGRLEQVRHYL